MGRRLSIFPIAIGLALGLGAGATQASPLLETLNGTLGSDDTVAFYTLPLSQTSNLAVSTDSYGGGTNLDGSTTPAGGFVPVISLFSPSGSFIADDGADINAPGAVDPVTGISDDAAFTVSDLVPGDYTLAVSEFFNFPNGNLADGFFAAGLGNFTGDTCSQPGASFLQADLVSCPQRTSSFTVNVSATAVPEPTTLALLVTAVLGFYGLWRRRTRGLMVMRRA